MCHMILLNVEFSNACRHIAGVQHEVNTSQKRRRRDADIRSAARRRGGAQLCYVYPIPIVIFATNL